MKKRKAKNLQQKRKQVVLKKVLPKVFVGLPLGSKKVKDSE